MLREKLDLRERDLRRRKMVRRRRLGIPDTVIAKEFGMSKQRVGQILGSKNGRARLAKPE